MGFKIDFSELEKLKDELKITEQEFNSFLYKFLLEMANRIIAKTKPRTPLDTGALRSAWAVETSKVSEKTVRRKHKNKKSKMYGKYSNTKSYTQEGDILVSGSGENLAVILSNPMEYATDVEYGHRIMGGIGKKDEIGWHEGRFMLKISIDEVNRQMPSRYKKALNAFCVARGLGNVN